MRREGTFDALIVDISLVESEESEIWRVDWREDWRIRFRVFDLRLPKDDQSTKTGKRQSSFVRDHDNGTPSKHKCFSRPEK